ncbi:hypothetical protein CDL15_Pgr007437 [Punica granatum]|uniref:Epidermal patterning factor-like protein n=1 Tax=Punica granatum TaxID=22663 RepID=A0A218X9L8_PUNGR|nr:hypothetical protein CDL15_Pgr007437 [Punica granatum]
MTAEMGHSDDEEGRAKMMTRQEITNRVHTLQIAGSRLPDCSHACGSCSPCRLVSVGNMCAVLAEAESCPVSYRCMCKNKSYPVP